MSISNNTFRTIDGRPIYFHDKQHNLMHACEGADVHPGIRLIWTLCERDVPANSAHISDQEDVTCSKCQRAASQGAFAGGDIASDERDIAGHAAKQRSEPGEAGVSGSIPERSTEALMKALTDILDAEKDFREAMGSAWSGDPLSDACDAARDLITKIQPKDKSNVTS